VLITTEAHLVIITDDDNNNRNRFTAEPTSLYSYER